MDFHNSVGCGCDACETDNGPGPFVANIVHAASQNQNFRTAFWTGNHLQMTLMCIPPCGDIGAEIHMDTDQVIQIVSGSAIVLFGSCKERLDIRHRIQSGDAVFVPCGTWHNIINISNCPLKLSSIYAPPHHPKCTVQRTKEDAAM